MSIARLMNTNGINRQRIFGFGVYILISFLLSTVLEQKFLSSCLGSWSNKEDHEHLITTAKTRRTISNDHLIRKNRKYQKNTKTDHVKIKYPRRQLSSRDDQLYDERQKYHDVSPLLASNITLTDIGIRPQDPIRVFYSEDSMCHDTPPADLKIVSPPETSSSTTTSTTSNITPSKQNQHQQLTDQNNNNSSSERIAVALVVPQGDCSLEQKLGNIAIWYQKEDHPAVKVVLFYEPTVPPASSASNISNKIIASIRKKQQNYQPSYSKNIISDSSFDDINSQKLDLTPVTKEATIIPFRVSQKTASCLKHMIDVKSLRSNETGTVNVEKFVDVRMMYQFFGGTTTTTNDGIKEKRKDTYTFVREIFVSFVVTILSLIVTGCILLLCWKDALSIEISRDGIYLISNNINNIDDSSPLIQEQRTTFLSAEQVLRFPEVKVFGCNSTNTKETIPMPPSCSTCIYSESAITMPFTSQPIQHHDSDEELHSTSILPASDLQVGHEIKISPATENLPYCCYNITCSICLEDFTKDETLRLLPCGHIFHTGCILPWLTKRATSCPLCKKCLCCYNKC